MLRFKFLLSIVPLIGAAVFARLELSPTPRPCISLGSGTLQMATSPWHADLHVSFTDDPALATVRVALADSAETADFAVVDDADEAEDGACAQTAATQFIAISRERTAGSEVIYLTHDGPADYRIFVRSSRFTAYEAAALIVGARSEPSHLADASS